MIVYLGMPRCASTWAYINLGFRTRKETHYLYTDASNPVEYVQSLPQDFSTNNWSMDSDTALEIDPYVTKYIFIYREPFELAKSYYGFLKATGPFTDFVQSMINGKLLCLGDILERWVKLVDSSKILVYNYNDVSESWLKQLAQDLELPIDDPIHYNDEIENRSRTGNTDWTITEQQREILDKQWLKLNQFIRNYKYGNN